MTQQPSYQKGLDAAHASIAQSATDKIAQVRTMIRQLLEDPHVPPGDINANRISNRPDCPSHDFLTKHSGKHAKERGYDHDLKSEIAEAREAKRKRLSTAAQDTDVKRSRDAIGLHAKVKTYQTRLATARQELKDERVRTTKAHRDLQIVLGAKLESQILIDPKVHQERATQIERLNGQVQDLVREIRQIQRGRDEANERVRSLEQVSAELGEALRACTCHGNVIHLTRHRPQR